MTNVFSGSHTWETTHVHAPLSAFWNGVTKWDFRKLMLLS